MFVEALVIMAIGVGVVFVVLGLLTLTIGGLRRCDAALEAWGKGKAKSVDAEPAPALPATETALDDVTLVAITAAVAAVVQRRFAIRAIHRLPTARGDSPWAARGRAEVQGSHVVLRRG